MVYGKEYKQLINFEEYDEELKFEEELTELCKKHKAVLFIEGREIEFKRD